MHSRVAEPKQRTLSEEQVKAFFHEEFVADQVRDFVRLASEPPAAGGDVVVDVGGGCGFFARRLNDAVGRPVRVLDLDPASIAECARAGVEASIGDALNPKVRGDEAVATFNLILHHLVSDSEGKTAAMQRRALEAWRPQVRAIFVNEYIYESFAGNAAGRLIFEITKSRILSAIGRIAARLAPSLKANTFGVGVRFRSHSEWVDLFRRAGYEVRASVIGADEPVSLPRRMLLIKNIRRDSFLLAPSQAREAAHN